jgi:osomolarity two-component system sensor histidine kinase SLN1
MDFFLSKPIRRPALKHVLKRYCPPIPEEEGEAVFSPTDNFTSSKDKVPNGGIARPANANSSLVTDGTAPKLDASSPAVSPLSQPLPR